MPGGKKLFQESENSAKPQYIHRHMFGGLGILAGNPGNWAFVLLISISITASRPPIGGKGPLFPLRPMYSRWWGTLTAPPQTFGHCLLLLDQYFLTMPALQTLGALNRSGGVHLEIVTKAKKSCIAYEKPTPRKPGRGRPPKKGAAVHLRESFVSRKERFLETRVELYGKRETIRYYSVDSLWGQKLYQELRFVLVKMNGTQSILASKYQSGAGTAFHHPPVRLLVPDRMCLSGAEAADRSILLSFLVKTYAKVKLLPENGGTWSPETGDRRKEPSEYPESGSGNRNAQTWSCLVSLWGYSKIFLSIRLENCPQTSFVTKELLPEEGCLRPRL